MRAKFLYNVFDNGKFVAVMTAPEISKRIGVVSSLSTYAKNGTRYKGRYTFTFCNDDPEDALFEEWEYWRNQFLKRGFRKKGQRA